MKTFWLRLKELCLTNTLLILLIFSIFISLIFCKYWGFLHEDKLPELIIATALLLGTIAYNMINYKIAHEQFFQQLFIDFNKRFDSMNENLNKIRLGIDIIEKDKNSNKTKDSIILDYLNLCSEEYLWFSKGRIDYKVWKAWREGMDYYLKNENFKEVFEKQKVERSSYYGLIEELEKK